MAFVFVMLLVAFVCFGIVRLLGSAEKSLYKRNLDKDNAKANEAEGELRPLFEELFKEKKEQYDEYLNDSNYKKSDFPVITTENIHLYFGISNSANYYYQKYDIWKNENNLCILTNWENLQKAAEGSLGAVSMVYSDESQYKKESELRKKMRESSTCQVCAFFIPLNNIEYFSMRGQKYATTGITGGGGTVGGSSLTGAVAGGIIAGGAGAVIGSRKETTIDPIQSYTDIHDETESYIKFKKEDGTLDEVVCTYCYSNNQSNAFYNALKNVIPEKEYSYIVAHSSVQEKSGENKNIEERLLQIKELFDKGLITQEEYEKKRENILEDM